MENCSFAFAFSIGLFFLCLSFVRENAKTAFLQAKAKLEVAEKKSRFEDALVRNLEMARDVLMNAQQTHIERDLVQGIAP